MECVDTLLSSLADNSWTQYNSSLKLWWHFCQSFGHNIYAPTSSTLLSFLQLMFSEGKSYSSLNTMRSAVSLLAPRANLGEDSFITRFFKGVGRVAPPKRKYNFIWDPAPVLSYLSSLHPFHKLSYYEITLKTIGLLALATAHRVQTFSKINVNNIHTFSDRIEILIEDNLKTSRPGKFQPCLVLPFFIDNPQLCAASAITEYLKITKKFRSPGPEMQKLFLSVSKDHTPVSSQTISRWIKTVLKSSGVDTTIYTAHSTRHAATTTAKNSGVPIDIIRDRAGWTATSSCFANFYNRPIDRRSDFAHSVLLSSI